MFGLRRRCPPPQPPCPANMIPEADPEWGAGWESGAEVQPQSPEPERDTDEEGTE